MKLLLSFILAFTLTGVATQEEEKFLINCKENYDYYQVLIDDELDKGDITIVLGSNSDQLSLSVFFYCNKENHSIKIIGTDFTKTYSPANSIVEHYQIIVDHSQDLIIDVSFRDTLYKEYNVIIPENITTFKQSAVVGIGKDNFPSPIKNINLAQLMKQLLIVFAILAAGFGIAIIVVVKTRKGRFNPNYQNAGPNPFEQPKQDVIDVEYEHVPNKTKQELMDELFEQYKKGIISEQELNERLRSLWWTDD